MWPSRSVRDLEVAVALRASFGDLATDKAELSG
jgi:hypothetical protein